MNENNKESKPQWKGCIIWSIVGIFIIGLGYYGREYWSHNYIYCSDREKI